MADTPLARIIGALDTERRIAVPAALIRLLGLREAVVLQQIRWHVDRFGVADVTGAMLADEIGLTESQVKPALARLVTDGVVTFSNPDPFSRRRIYRIASIDRRDPSVEGLDHDRPEGLDRARPEGLDRARLPIESDLENEEKTTTATEVARSSFDAFWNEYPKSRRRERAVCEKLFREAAKSGAAKSGADVAAGLDRWLDYWRTERTEDRFITTSVVWLRHRCWEDDPRIASTGNGAKPKHQASPGTPLFAGSTDRSGVSGEW